MTPPNPHRVYAVKYRDSEKLVSVGISTGAAWQAAENEFSESTKNLQKMGYVLVEGIWEWIPEIF